MNNTTQTLILVRGVSGSGKSTFAKKLASELGVSVFESDEFFIVEGEYRFDPSKLGWAHKSNQRRTLKALEDGKTVIVANTLTTLKEIREYTSMAESLGIPVSVYRSEGRFQNTHGVPAEKVQAMRDRMVDYPGETIINN
jgi:predicted kinase